MVIPVFKNVFESLRKSFSNAEHLTEPVKYDEPLNPRIIEPDPFASDEDINVFSLESTLHLNRFEDDTMNADDEPLSGLNGRLRPRRSAAPSPLAPKVTRKPESKPAADRPKRTSTPSKAAATTKPDDLANKSDSPTAPQLLCPYCDRKFASKQNVSKHARRIHLSFSKQDSFIDCLFCAQSEADHNDIIRHMVDNHPNQYFACLDCYTRFSSTSELAEHKLKTCEKQKEKPYRSKLRQKVSSGSKKGQKTLKLADDKDFSDNKDFPQGHCFNGVVISCELKPSQVGDEADIEDNITTNLILPPSKTLGSSSAIEKNAVIVLDDIQWNKRMPTNFSFHNTDADQILSRLGVVHRSPRTGESTKKDWFKNAEEPVQKFEKCFDTGFYPKVASNVHENLAKFLDGSFNFNPDPDAIIKTRKSKQSVVINTAEGFPILLAFEQFSRNIFDEYMPRTLAPKHKWKWESDKIPLLPDDIKRDTHVNNCIITLVSSLDIWTQLCMRRKFEEKFNIPPLEKKTVKQSIISRELKEILESRELPKSSQQVVKYVSKPMPPGDSLDFPASLGLKPSSPTYDMQPAVLSGEWVRPRCYVCCACGAQTRDSRGLSSHISTQHPNAQVQHYEIVGELLLNADILKHLYVPPSQMCNRTRPLRGFRECTKCKKSISLEDLHQHMLDCAGDMPTVRRKCRYRPFGVRRRRPRLPDNTIRKKIRKDIRSRQTRQKTHMRQRTKIRSEVGDAETIRKMLADLPAKRHRVMVNPMNPNLRPRRKLDKQRNKIIMNRRSSEIARNRKQREMKKENDSNTSRSNKDDNDNKNIKSDDENKPLKPKMKRVLTHGPRQSSESLKRKVALNRAKRRAKMKEQRANEEAAKQKPPEDVSGDGAGPSGIRGDQLSIDNNSQRIDVSGGPYGAREHSSRGSRSNNRDDQRPGSSGSQNGNINNPFGSFPNTPLKHSIARITSEAEIHDRAMQYHHIYMMQRPECTEVDPGQHVPSGQQRVFENEAIVTKLDKPPLHFNLPAPLDAYAYRNKLPKPKKGLNDCIAMLKNKLVDPIPTTKLSESIQCGNDDRLDCETMVANQRGAAADYPLNMNTRPAEIFSRHQLLPERYIDYPSDAGLIAQNFAELPFHYVPSQRIPFDLLPPEAMMDPRYVKALKQAQIEGQNKTTTRRRSTRSDKAAAKKQDVSALSPLVNYPVNVSSPSKVPMGLARRASTGPINTNTAARRRASVSYNRNLKQINEYEAMLAQQRVLEYHAQRISPETHLMDVNLRETYTQAQINKQNQMIAEQMIAEQMMLENYVNKKQLAICVDNNYSNKMLTAAFAESMYNASKNMSLSPGSSYKRGNHASVSPGNRHDNNKQPSVSPGSRYDNSKHQSVSPGARYDSSKNLTVSPESNKHLMVSPGSGYDHYKYRFDSSGNRYENSKHLTVSPGARQDHNTHLPVSPGSSYDSSKVIASPVSRYDSTKHMSTSPGTMYDTGKYAAVSPGSSASSKQAVSPETHDQRKIADAVSESMYVTQRANVSPEIPDTRKRRTPNATANFDSNRPPAIVIESQHDKYADVNPTVDPIKQYDNLKPAEVSPRSKVDNFKHGIHGPDTHYDDRSHAPVVAGRQFDSSKNLAVGLDRPDRLVETSKRIALSPKIRLDSVVQTTEDNRKQASSSPVSRLESGKQKEISQSDNSRPNSAGSTGPSDIDHRLTISPKSKLDSIDATESRLDNVKKAGKATEITKRKTSGPANHHKDDKNTISPDSQLDTSKYAKNKSESQNDAVKCTDRVLESKCERITRSRSNIGAIESQPRSKYDKSVAISSGNKLDKVKDAPKIQQDSVKPATVAPEIIYDKNAEEQNVPGKIERDSPGTTENRFDKKARAISARNDLNQQDVADLRTIEDNITQAAGKMAANPDNKSDGNKYSVVENQNPNTNTSDGSKLKPGGPEGHYENATQGAISPGSNVNSGNSVTVNSGTNYNNSQHIAVSPESQISDTKLASVNSGSQLDRSSGSAVSPGIQNDNNKYSTVSPRNKYVRSTSPHTNYITKKQAAVAADGNYNNSKHANNAGLMETNYINKKQAAVSEHSHQKPQQVLGPENIPNKPYADDVSNDIELLAKAEATYVENTFLTKKAQAIATENKMANKTQTLTSTEKSGSTNILTRTDSNAINENQTPIHAESKFSNSPPIQNNDDALFVNRQIVAGSIKPPAAMSIDIIERNFVDNVATSSCDFMTKQYALNPESYLNKPIPRNSENSYISKKLTDLLPVRNLVRKIAGEYYTENEYIQTGGSQPYAEVSSKYKRIPPVTETPLDLSKASINNTSDKLKNDANLHNYETLDLSHKASDSDDGVVDLRVKITSPGLGSKRPPSTSDDRNDLMINNIPNDFTARATNNDGYQYDDPVRNSNYMAQELGNSGLAREPPFDKEVAVLPSFSSDSLIPSNLHPHPNVSISLTSAKINCDAKDITKNSDERLLSDLPSGFPSNRDQAKYSNLANVVQHQDSLLMINRADLETEKENAYDNYMPPMSMGKYSLMTNEMYGPPVPKSHYDLQSSVSASEPPPYYDERSCSPGSSMSTVVMSDNNINVDDNTFSNDTCSSIPPIHGSTSSTAIDPIPLYTLSNGNMPIAMAKYESTTPVYTLANACISMAKAESPAVPGPLSDAILSIPSTTIASVAPVYTLTDTTVNPSMNFMPPHNKCDQDLTLTPKQSSITENEETKNFNLSSSIPPPTLVPIDEKSTNKDNSGNFDPETAKKIAMLPKELVEILGTMPVDHRNQLLNVLPQYVSTSVPSSQKDYSNTAVSAASLVNRGVSPTRLTDVDVKPSIHSPVTSSQARPVTTANSNTDRIEESKSFPLYQSAIGPQSVCEIRKYEPPEQISKVYEIDGRTVIDLTEDDVPPNGEAAKVVEEINDAVIKPNDPIPVVPSDKTNKPKNNVQTASLRAVRIKTPSERNKSVSIENTVATKPKNDQMQSNVEVVKNTDHTTDLDKTLAIQQAEITSTQHNPTNTGNCKYPLAISPSSTEYSGDESSKPVSQQSPVPPTVVLKEQITDKKIESLVPKTGMVSSSISTNEAKPNNAENIVDVGISHAIDETDTSLKGSTENQALIEKPVLDQNVPAGESDSSKPPSVENAEDSDDDISLAAIVKQKQRDLAKVNNTTSCSTKRNSGKTTSKKKKKERKGKKELKSLTVTSEDITSDTLKNEDLQPAITTVTLNKSVEKNEQVIDTSLNEVQNQDQSMIPKVLSKHPKKEGRRGRRIGVELEIADKQKLESACVDIEKDINKENDNTSKVINNKVRTENNSGENIDSQICNKGVLQDDVICSEVVKVTKNLSNKEVVTDPIVMISKCDDKLPTYSVKTTKDSSKHKEKKKVVFPEVEKPKKDQIITPEDKNISNSIEIVEKQDSVSSLITESGLNYIDLKDKSSSSADDDKDKFYGTTETKKNKKSLRSKKSKIDDLKKVTTETDSSLENILNISELKENASTPLRRSRRGKSLFMDNKLNEALEQDPVTLSDKVIEQKTPLTKKQLIFSKLLLDEGTAKPLAHSTPEKQDLIEKDDSVTLPEKSVVVPEISESEPVDEVHSEKSKGTKRRISAQFPKKSKKKKSVDGTIITSKVTDSSKAQTEDNAVDILKSPGEVETNSSRLNDSLNEFTGDDKNDSMNNNAQWQEFDTSKNNNNNDNHTVSTEKRKNNNQISFDLSQSSKPKKSKMSKSDNKVETPSSSESSENSSNKKEDHPPSVSLETKTACYNLPLPMRRARSKSVVVKSSTYDPYDIDLEDMVEQNEMFKRKEKSIEYSSKSNNKNSKSANVSNKENSKTTKRDLKDNRKSETVFVEKSHKNNEDDRNAVCDSDDSSKSDVPLQKYVEEKEKKYQEVEATVLKDKELKAQVVTKEYVEHKDAKRSQPATDVSPIVTQSEAEEELRSKQFMESFGFFSERKPRKSNLLASKKISETIHITNESDDMYFGFKERTGKKNVHTESKKTVETDTSKNQPLPSTSKRAAAKRGRRKKTTTQIIMPCYCEVCKKEFRRSDNYLRHQMSLSHVSKFSEVELKFKPKPSKHDEPNYLIAYKQYIDRLKKLTDILAMKKKKFPRAASKIVLPTLAEILADVNKKVRDQQRCGLSRDEALFLDCCELLKESHIFGARGRFGMSGLDILEKAINEIDTNDTMSDDGDCDSITAQTILESEEVRNLENDLISGLKEAAKATRNANFEYKHSLNEFTAPQVVEMVEQEKAQHSAEVVDQEVIENQTSTLQTQSEEFSSPNAADSHYDQIEEFDVPAKPRSIKVKKHIEVKETMHIEIKEKMYPDILIEDIDMFEDKFDKIKRKCRSQAAAAKQPQPVVDQTISHNHKARKKSEKKKGKRSSKKARHQSTHVPTKGALKGFDGIKVSIPTSDINMPAIVPVSESSPKKKKKSGSKKKRDKRDSESSSKYDSDHRAKENASHKKVDVYEFMDNEDAELFEFRPSTLMERFKSISNNRDMASTSKGHPAADDNSSQGSASDGDDFVYMSDDYVGSGDDETENSLMSCELGNVKVGSDIRKSTPQKRKDVVEKNAVMGKIFKHNAVRAEKKVPMPKEPEKPKANLDQLFDSLLEEEPNSSVLNSEAVSPTDDEYELSKKYNQLSEKSDVSRKIYDQSSDNDIFAYPSKSRSSSPGKHDGALSTTTPKRRNSSPTKDYVVASKKRDTVSSKKYDLLEEDYRPSVSKSYVPAEPDDYGPSTSKKYHNHMPKDVKKSSPKSYDSIPFLKNEEKSFKTKNKKRNDSLSKNDDDEQYNTYDEVKSPSNKPDEGISTSYDYSAEVYDQSVLEDEAGVARQRARRKCTVGKQNVLAETWSSESEPDGGPPRPNSAESVMAGVTRKKKGRKKEGQQSSGRRGNSRHVVKKQDVESRVSSNRTLSSASSAAGAGSVDDYDPGEGTSGMCFAVGSSASSSAIALSDSAAAAAAASAAMPAPSTSAVAGPSNVKGRPRPATYYWSSENDDEQEHLQQHGWIVGDSHKKLVTMLAHAKGRKRNNDEKRHLVE